MKRLAMFVVLLSVSMFALGCSQSTEKKDTTTPTAPEATDTTTPETSPAPTTPPVDTPPADTGADKN